MNPLTSTSFAAQIYNGVQRTNSTARGIEAAPSRSDEGFRLPSNATPRGDWVLSENADPQGFEAGSPRGSYLNVVV